MYLWLWIVVGFVWAWLATSTVSGWWRDRLGGFWMLSSVAVWTGLAGLAILFVGPYWHVVYDVFIQPG